MCLSVCLSVCVSVYVCVEVIAFLCRTEPRGVSPRGLLHGAARPPGRLQVGPRKRPRDPAGELSGVERRGVERRGEETRWRGVRATVTQCSLLPGSAACTWRPWPRPRASACIRRPGTRPPLPRSPRRPRRAAACPPACPRTMRWCRCCPSSSKAAAGAEPTTSCARTAPSRAGLRRAASSSRRTRRPRPRPRPRPLWQTLWSPGSEK